MTPKSNRKSGSFLWMCILVLWVSLLGVYSLWDLMGRDQGIFSTFGVAMGEGLLPYRDLYDTKPPMTFVLSWASYAVFAPDDFALRKTDLLIAIAAAMGLARIVAVMGGGERGKCQQRQ